jgi:hypothetical protein
MQSQILFLLKVDASATDIHKQSLCLYYCYCKDVSLPGCQRSMMTITGIARGCMKSSNISV